MIPIRNKKKTLKVTVEEMRNFAFAYVEKYAPSKQQLKTYLLKKYLKTSVPNVKKKDVNDLIDPHQYNFYTGMFDFSDDGRKSTLVGIQHQNENLYKDTFLGTLSPVTGFLVTGDTATYLYTGVQAEYSLGKLILHQVLLLDCMGKVMVKI